MGISIRQKKNTTKCRVCPDGADAADKQTDTADLADERRTKGIEHLAFI
jgi:hypothetical protein